MQSIKRIGVCALASAACCATAGYGDVAIQDLAPVMVTPVMPVMGKNLLTPSEAIQSGTHMPDSTNQNEPKDATMLLGLLAPLFAPVLTEPPLNVDQILSATASQKAAPRYDLVIQDCRGLETQTGGGESLSPAAPVRLFLNNQAGHKVNIDFTKAKIQVLTPPTNGTLTSKGTINPDYRPRYFYTANPGYVGKDKIVYAIQVGGKNIKVEQLLNVVPIYTGSSETFCAGKPSYIKRISAADFQSDWTDSWQAQSALSELLSAASRVSYSFSDLPSTAVGETVGEGLSATITLDTNAESSIGSGLVLQQITHARPSRAQQRHRPSPRQREPDHQGV